mgnify:FL=1
MQVHDGAQLGTYTTAEGDGLSGSTAGEVAEFEVIVRDLYGNLRSDEDELVVTLTPLNRSFNYIALNDVNFTLDVVDGIVENIGIGHYRVTYNTTIRGIHELSVMVSTSGGALEHISGSPWLPYTKVGVTLSQFMGHLLAF